MKTDCAEATAGIAKNKETNIFFIFLLILIYLCLFNHFSGLSLTLDNIDSSRNYGCCLGSVDVIDFLNILSIYYQRFNARGGKNVTLGRDLLHIREVSQNKLFVVYSRHYVELSIFSLDGG